MALVKENTNIPLRRAWEILKASIMPLEPEECPVEEAAGRILAMDVMSGRNVPHYNAAAMDGYAVSSRSTAGASPSSPVHLGKGDFAWLNTGGALPPAFDSLVMVEDTSLDGGAGILTLVKSLVSGENVRPLGEDVFAGQVLAPAGDAISPALASLFATAGISSLAVLPVPRTLYVPTGDEILPLSRWLETEAPPPGVVCESNSLLVRGYFRKWGFPLEIGRCLPDDPAVIEEYLASRSGEYDLILVGAGSAKGEKDHTFTIFEKMGTPLFRWLLMKPGRPASAALLRRGTGGGKKSEGVCAAVNLPGFPMSNAVVLWSVVYPLLQLLQRGSFDEKNVLPEALEARDEARLPLLLPHSSSFGKEEWVRLKCIEVDGVRSAYPLPSGAGSLWSLAETDALALLPLETAECPKGTPVSMWILKKIRWGDRILFQGSNDPAMERVASFVRKRGGELLKRSVGSMGGLSALSRRECHLAACHLLDTATGLYNSPFISKIFGPSPNLRRRLIFFRQQGFILARGNPKEIRSVKDLARKDVTMVNRQPGAGTRVLLDYLLGREGISTAMVCGYAAQSPTHFDAANRVALGFADVALGIRSVADALGLEFLPVCEEPYELVYPSEYEAHPGMKALFGALSDGKWREMVSGMGGYRWPEEPEGGPGL